MAYKQNTESEMLTERNFLLVADGDKRSESCVKQRYILVIGLFFGFAVAYSTRVNISVAMVTMVNNTYVLEQNRAHHHNRTEPDSCPNLKPENVTHISAEGEFKWSHYTQGVVLSSFYYGYIVTQLPGGYLADKYGAKHVVGLGVFLGTMVSLFSPIAARTSVYLLIFVVILEGLLQGLIFPSATTILAAWSPLNERSITSAVSHFGLSLGVVVTYTTSGALCVSEAGWPSVFYVFGVLGAVWYPAWLYFVSNSPENHPRISLREKDYIINSLPPTKRRNIRVPWLKILTSLPVWATVISMGGSLVSYGALLAFLPTYMAEILKYNAVVGGIVSIAPHVPTLLLTPVLGYLSDYLSIKLKSVTASRKIMVFISNIACGIACACIPFVGCNRTAVIILLVVTGVFGSFSYVGNTVNPIDLAPQYAGSIYGFSNVFGTLGMLIGPYITGALTNDAQTLWAWSRAFYFMAALSIISGVFYLIFGSGDIQPWAIEHVHDAIENEDSAKKTRVDYTLESRN